MCRCAKNRRYLLIWSNEKEMTTTLESVREYCEFLKTDEDRKLEATNSDSHEEINLPDVAPGVTQDLANHRGDEINVEPVIGDPVNLLGKQLGASVSHSGASIGGGTNPPSRVTSDESTIGAQSDEKDSSDDGA